MLLNLQKDQNLINELIQEFNKRKTIADKQYKYYIGKTDAYEKYEVNEDRCNRKVNDNFIKTFIDEEVAFMVGQPITYVSKSNNKQCIEDIYTNLNNSSATLDLDLATNLLIFGEAYELKYLDEDEFKVKTYNSKTSIGYINEENKVEFFIRFYRKMLDDTIYMDIIDDKFIYKCTQNNYITPLNIIPHYFSRCPVGYCCIESTLYNDIKTLQDAYEYTMNDWTNEIGDTRLAYMVFSGCDLTPEQAKEMKKMGIIQLPNEKSNAQYLIKNLNSDFLRSYRDIVKEDIYRVSQHIDNQTQIQSNTSGTMLQTRMNCLRLKILSQNQALKDCLKDRIKCLFKYLNITENKDYDISDIKIEPQLNLPKNDVEIAQIMSQLNGKLSIRTGLSKLSFVTNADEEFNKMLEESKMIAENEEPKVDLDMVGEEDEVNQEPTTI